MKEKSTKLSLRETKLELQNTNFDIKQILNTLGIWDTKEWGKSSSFKYLVEDFSSYKSEKYGIYSYPYIGISEWNDSLIKNPLVDSFECNKLCILTELRKQSIYKSFGYRLISFHSKEWQRSIINITNPKTLSLWNFGSQSYALLDFGSQVSWLKNHQKKLSELFSLFIKKRRLEMCLSTFEKCLIRFSSIYIDLKRYFFIHFPQTFNTLEGEEDLNIKNTSIPLFHKVFNHLSIQYNERYRPTKKYINRYYRKIRNCHIFTRQFFIKEGFDNFSFN